MNANNQDRNQAHYFSRSISSLLVLLLLSFIIIIAGSCKKNSEEKPEEEYILASVSKPVDQSGSTITLPQVATVFFDPNTFEKTVECKLYNSNKPATQDDLKLAAALFGMTELFNYEIRVNTGIIEPKKNVKIEINLTDEFINKVSGDLGIRGYAKLFVDDDNEKTENFESIVSKYYGSRKVVQLELDPSYFSNAWTSDNSFEAIISVGITPGINPSAGRTTIDCAGGSYISCPINTCSVASAFNPSRLHPITNRPTPHRGVDFHGATGTPVKAASDGEVIAAGYQFNETTKTGWGNYIIISHKNSQGQRFATLYAHLDKNLVTSGRVVEGQQIALSGKTGGVSGPHLHFEYVTNANIGSKEARVDPVPYINTTLPRLISAAGSVIGVNSCSGGTRTSWQVVFNFKDPSNSIGQGGELVFQDIEPVTNPPYSVPVNLLNSNNGTVSTSLFCARWDTYSYFKVKVFIRLTDGRESNCIFFNLPKPPGANRGTNSNNVNDRTSSYKL